MALTACVNAANRFYRTCLLADTPFVAHQLELGPAARNFSDRKLRSIQNQTLRHRVAGDYSDVSNAAALYVESEAVAGAVAFSDCRRRCQCCLRDLALAIACFGVGFTRE